MVGAIEPGELLDRLTGDIEVSKLLIVAASPANVEVFLTASCRIAELNAVNVNRAKYVGVVTRLQGHHRGVTSPHPVDVSRWWHKVLAALTVGRFVDVDLVWVRKGRHQPLSCDERSDP